MAGVFDSVGAAISAVGAEAISYYAPDSSVSVPVTVNAFTVNAVDERESGDSEATVSRAVINWPASAGTPERLARITRGSDDWIVDSVRMLPGGDFSVTAMRSSLQRRGRASGRVMRS